MLTFLDRKCNLCNFQDICDNYCYLLGCKALENERKLFLKQLFCTQLNRMSVHLPIHLSTFLVSTTLPKPQVFLMIFLGRLGTNCRCALRNIIMLRGLLREITQLEGFTYENLVSAIVHILFKGFQ